MRWYSADFHVHTLLSPCAAVEMTPRNIVRNALAAQVDIVAITDHNAGDNVQAALRAAEGSPLVILPGMEVETREEVHLLALFEKMRDFVKWKQFVEIHRSRLLNDETRLGAQFVVDEEDNLLRTEEMMLLASTDLEFAAAARQIVEFGGLAIAAHVDRPAYSVLSQLGFIPPDAPLAAVEVSRNTKIENAPAKCPGIGQLPIVSSSDAHTMDGFLSGPKNMLLMEAPTLSEIRLALRNTDGRRLHRT